MKPILLMTVLLSCAGASLATHAAAPAAASASAPAAFAGQDYSGVYDCTGDDSKEGKYTATVTLALQPAHSVGRDGSYSLKMEVPGYGTYLGHVVANDTMAALHFALTDPKPHDFGTGLASISKTGGKTRFHKFYYEPEFKGGNHGTEDCIKR